MLAKTLPAHLAHPFSPAGRVDPYPAYAWFRENDPVHFEKMSGWWLVTSHAGCAAALADARFSASLGQQERTREDELPASMLTSDAPDHARLRGPGALLLGPAALRAQLGGLDEMARGVLDRLDARAQASHRETSPVADTTTDIGEPFAVEVFARLFALEAGQVPAFTELASRVSVNLDPMGGAAAGHAGRRAAAEFSEFMDRHIREKVTAGPLARLAADPRLSRAEMLGILTLTVVGGFLPLADLPAHAMHWMGGPNAEGGAVDEVMRLATPIPFTARVTRQAVELDGTPLPQGARVLLMIGSANRDTRVFDRPGQCDPRRSPNPHLAFGAGPHVCLGAPLVRLAGGTLLRELARRYPQARPLGPAEWDKPLVPRRLIGQRLQLRP